MKKPIDYLDEEEKELLEMAKRKKDTANDPSIYIEMIGTILYEALVRSEKDRERSNT